MIELQMLGEGFLDPCALHCQIVSAVRRWRERRREGGEMLGDDSEDMSEGENGERARERMTRERENGERAREGMSRVREWERG